MNDNERELLDLFFDRMPMGLAIVNPDFTLRRVNQTWAAFIERYTPSTAADVRPGACLFDLEPGTEDTLRPLFAPAFAGEIVRVDGVRLESEGQVSYWDVELRPLEQDGRVFAVLDVSLDATERVLAQEQLEERVAQRTAEIERRRRVAESLADILRVINSTRPLPDILDHIVTEARRLMEAGVCVLHRVDYARSLVIVEANSGLPDCLQDIDGLPLHASHWDAIILDRRPVVAGDIRGQRGPGPLSDKLDPRVRRWRETMTRAYAAVMAVPLVIQDVVYGSMAFYFSEPRGFSEDEIELARSVGDQAALAIDNAQLRIRAEEAAAAAERARLAADLHDAVTQTLFSASLIAEVLPRIWTRDPQQGALRLAELCELNRGALAEMRALLLELRPGALIESSLGDLLNQLAVAAGGRARLPIDVRIDGTRALPPDIQVSLYRIAQESINNVIRHAAARRATIGLRLAADAVELSIADDGCGFDAAGRGQMQSLGLRIMRERAERIGGELAVMSAPGEGTRVVVSCPLPPWKIEGVK